MHAEDVFFLTGHAAVTPDRSVPAAGYGCGTLLS